MSIKTYTRWEAKGLMAILGKARYIVKSLKTEDDKKALAMLSPEDIEEIMDGLEYLYHMLSIFAWLTMGQEAMMVGQDYRGKKDEDNREKSNST